VTRSEASAAAHQAGLTLYVCESGRWDLAKRYDTASAAKATGDAKLSLRGSDVAAVRVLLHSFDPGQQTPRRELLLDLVKTGAKPPPPPPEAMPVGKPSAAAPEPAAAVAPRQPARPAAAPRRRNGTARPRRAMSRGKRLALAGGAGAAAAAAGPMMLSTHLAADLALAGGVHSGGIYLLALGLFLATFGTILYATAAPPDDAAPRAPGRFVDGALPSAEPRLGFADAMSLAFATAAPLAESAGSAAQEAGEGGEAARLLAAHKTRLLDFLQRCLSEAATEKYLPQGQMDGQTRFGLHLFMLGAGQACLTLLPAELGLGLGDLIESALAALGSDPAKARSFAAEIDSYRGQPKQAAMIRAGADAMAVFLRDNAASGTLLAQALGLWTASERGAAPAAGQDVAILFTDLLASPETSESLGERGMISLVEQHNLIVGAVLKTHRGHQVKHTGDGIMAVFPRVGDGIAAAGEMQRQIAAHNEATLGTGLRIRIGLAAGNPIRTETDYFGTVVQLAARLCAFAGPGEVALPDAMTKLAGCDGFAYSPAIAVPLKGFAEPQAVRKLLQPRARIAAGAAADAALDAKAPA
jgi:adenylate cyclase